MNILLHLSEYIIPVLILSILMFAVVKKINAYEEFVGGAKEGLKTVVAILPTRIGLLVAVRVLRASGFLEFLSRGIGYILRGTGLPNEIIPLVIVKMFSSSAATTGYARTQEDADRFNASYDKPSGLTFVVKS